MANMKEFKKFIKDNKNIIDKITPKNPIIKKDDEWVKENWDEQIHSKEI